MYGHSEMFDIAVFDFGKANLVSLTTEVTEDTKCARGRAKARPYGNRYECVGPGCEAAALYSAAESDYTSGHERK